MPETKNEMPDGVLVGSVLLLAKNNGEEIERAAHFVLQLDPRTGQDMEKPDNAMLVSQMDMFLKRLFYILKSVFPPAQGAKEAYFMGDENVDGISIQ